MRGAYSVPSSGRVPRAVPQQTSEAHDQMIRLKPEQDGLLQSYDVLADAFVYIDNVYTSYYCMST